MDDRNPYAPPVESSDAYPPPRPAAGGLSLSSFGWDIVSGMSKWMKIVSVLLYIAGALFLTGSLAFASCAGQLPWASAGARAAQVWISIGALGVMGILFLAGATWLRQAATHFYDGVLAGAERPLGLGFRKLRLYLILYGLYAIFGLLAQIAGLVS